MRTDSAVELVNQVVSKPGWRLTASVSDRFEDTIVLRVDYPTRQFNREDAPGYDTPITANASFLIPVGDVGEPQELYRRVVDKLVFEIECHEHREAFRVGPTWYAPFHPHRLDGMERWGEPERDLLFGVV